MMRKVMPRRERKLVHDINVVPYIDVMLVLLVIFMITTPLLSQGVKIHLPQASAKTLTTKQPQPIIVSIDNKGLYYLNIAQNPNQALTAQQLALRIAAQLEIEKQQGQHRQVLIKGDKAVDYGKVVQAMVLLQHAGVAHIGLMTQPPAKQQA